MTSGKIMSKASIAIHGDEDISDLVSMTETLSERAVNGTIKSKFEALGELDRLSHMVTMYKRELERSMLKEIIDNEWYDVLSVNKQALKRYL